jgi:L-aminopeptidase/D-esterase-like protein
MDKGGTFGRRRFAMALGGGAAGLLAAASRAEEGPAGALTDVAGLKVGHFTDPRRPTGCTAVLAEGGAVCGVDVRGGAPGTRETDLLDPSQTVGEVHALVLAGGSAFGLDAASGVVRFLEEKGVGFPVRNQRVPIVPAAILYDLDVGDGRIRPDAAAGYQAARAAAAGAVEEGSVGAGAGATVGKLFGLAGAMRGGLGTAALRLPGGAVVAALVAVNAAGDVVEEGTGRIVAGARDGTGRGFVDCARALREGRRPGGPPAGANTTLGIVATNVTLTKAEARKVAQMAHDGLARTIRPVHTPWDGDTVFALSTRALEWPAASLVVGALAADALAAAVVRAVRLARGVPGFPAARDVV